MNRNIYICLLIIINILLDQISKFWIRASVIPGSKTEILGDYLTLRNVENSGAFLGMGSDLNPTLRIVLLLIVPVLVMGYVLVYMFRNKDLDRLSVIGFSCIVGGGIANIFDRFVYGHVTDFLHIDLGGVFRTGIFNVADMSVMFGLALLILSSYINKKPVD